MSEPLTHIIRTELPWRRGVDTRTECGLRADSYPSVTRDEAVARVRKMGQQRSAMFFCMTCLYTADRWRPWEVDPVDAIRRDANSVAEIREALHEDLFAIALLIEAHRQEFDELLAGLRATVDLGKLRAQKRRR